MIDTDRLNRVLERACEAGYFDFYHDNTVEAHYAARDAARDKASELLGGFPASRILVRWMVGNTFPPNGHRYAVTVCSRAISYGEP
jgi:hypothetical protein